MNPWFSQLHLTSTWESFHLTVSQEAAYSKAIWWIRIIIGISLWTATTTRPTKERIRSSWCFTTKEQTRKMKNERKRLSKIGSKLKLAACHSLVLKWPHLSMWAVVSTLHEIWKLKLFKVYWRRVINKWRLKSTRSFWRPKDANLCNSAKLQDTSPESHSLNSKFNRAKDATNCWSSNRSRLGPSTLTMMTMWSLKCCSLTKFTKILKTWMQFCQNWKKARTR